MRDFRDAKAMAQTLRNSLTHKAVNISHSESLELVAKMLGLADWNTLSALLQAERGEMPGPVARFQGATALYPVIPIRDFVPFPTAIAPLFVGREKTIHSIQHAFQRQREVVLAVQKDSGVDDPGLEDVHEIGVFARLLELEVLADGTIKILTQGHRRVIIRRFVMETGALQVEVADVSEGPIPDAPDLIRRVIRRFQDYAAAREILIPNIWPILDQARDPGRVADIIAARLRVPIEEKYRLLATLDPVIRLERAEAHLDFSTLPFSPVFEATRQCAVQHANQRNHRYATLEHLLLALLDDEHASAVVQRCGTDLDKLRSSLIQYLDNELKTIVVENFWSAEPTPAFQRVERRAALHAQERGHPVVTGANALFAMFAETRSPAARLLNEQGVSLDRAAKAIAEGIGKGAG